MKTFAVLLPLFGLAVMGYAGPTNQLDLQRATPQKPQPAAPAHDDGPTPAVPLETRSPSRFLRDEKTYSGVLPELRRRKSQFLKPAPLPAGVELQNVSVHPITGRADGIIFFSINF